MASSNNNNKKLPDSDAKWEYPWNQVTQTMGGHEIHWNSTPGEESYRNLHPYGTYTEISKDGKKVELVANKRYKFVSNGASVAVEGSNDMYVKGGSRVTNDQGVHRETGEDNSHAIHGQQLVVSKGAAYHHSVETINHVGEAGQFTDLNDGDHHTNVKGDKVTFVDGTKYEQVNGEHGTHIPNGNMDFQVDQGKTRIKSGDDQLYQSEKNINTVAKEDVSIKADQNVSVNAAAQIKIKGDEKVTITTQECEITADTKIVLKVGSSKITITSSGIDIESSGEITTQGSATKLQGGGMNSPPLTVT
jgi:uncharacterized protein (DUF2345 family)